MPCNDGLKMIVDFIIIGAAKSATTSLSFAVSQHPDICFSKPKEPDFFNTPDWRSQIASYHSLFNKKAKLYGEGSTNYSKFPDYNKNIHQDIYEYNPKMKFIYIMRHPIERIISQYVHAYNRGYETIGDINEALKTNPHYLNTGKYAAQIAPYMKQFGRDNVLLLFFEDFKRAPQETTNTVFNFLGVSSIQLDLKPLHSNKSFNRRILHHNYDNPQSLADKFKKILLILKNAFNSDFIDKSPEISEETRTMIINDLRNDIEKIAGITGRDLSHWLI